MNSSSRWRSLARCCSSNCPRSPSQHDKCNDTCQEQREPARSISFVAFAATNQLDDKEKAVYGRDQEGVVAPFSQTDLDRLAREFRTQKIVFETARDVFDQMQKNWSGNRNALLAQLVRLVERFITSDKIKIVPEVLERDELKKRLIVTLNLPKLVQHVFEAIRFENSEKLEPVFDRGRPIRSTGDMMTWYTGKPCERTERSHINFCVYDSAWEASESFELGSNPNVAAWGEE